MQLLTLLERLWKIYFPRDTLQFEARHSPKFLDLTTCSFASEINDADDTTLNDLITKDDKFLSALFLTINSIGEHNLFFKLYFHFLNPFVTKFQYPSEMKPVVVGYGYTMALEDDFNFYHLKCGTRSATHERGWKMHLSLDDKDIKNLKNAWEILLKQIFEYQIGRTKIINCERVAKDSKRPNYERGKHITIYLDDSLPLETLIIFLQKIQHLYVVGKIKPGEKGEHVRYINDYFGFRYDADEDGGYRHPKVGPYKPDSIPDLFDDIQKKKALETSTKPNSSQFFKQDSSDSTTSSESDEQVTASRPVPRLKLKIPKK